MASIQYLRFAHLSPLFVCSFILCNCSRCRRADEIEDKLTERTITFLEFVEGLCRIAERKTMPSVADCVRCNVRNPVELYESYVAGTLAGKKGIAGGGDDASSTGGSSRNGGGVTAAETASKTAGGTGADFRTRGPRGFAGAIEQTEDDRVRPLASKVLALLSIVFAKLQHTQLICVHAQTEKIVRASAEKTLVEWGAAMRS